ncbi:hypothetical protein FNW25_09090 [Flavobacterium franklandianum]|uniref:hypothetical protein n=1 Tax=Flavobacterium franklandianum TaxID=2594430 RepID=UPI0011798FC7|nr:hypothetical protein [Flavobacterium franklandianum]TRX25342.1 hypothetical protein FNW25_09090 [Flavobacterium franklandianum]
MYRKITIILIYLLIYSSYNCRKSTEAKPTESCFTQKNFDLVYKFVENQNIKTKSKFFKYGDTKVYLGNDKIITLEKGNNYSKIHRKKGIFSLSMYKTKNIEMKEEANRLFCDLVTKANK